MTDFEWEVLAAAMTIPYGETRSYKWIAQKIGRAGAVRAVGQALRKNPYAPVIPCHRVIRSDGEIGGYGGKQDPRKEKMIAVEKEVAAVIPQP